MESDENVIDTTNPLYQLLEKQATEFELFGQRLKSEIQNSYREFIKLQKSKSMQIVNSHTDQTTNMSNTQMIMTSNRDISKNEELRTELDSLKARIEELETDSIIKNQDIEKQKSEIKQLKDELNKNDTTDIKKLNQEINELNEFKYNFMNLFDLFGSELSELKIKLEQKEMLGDSLLAEKLQLNEINNDNLMPNYDETFNLSNESEPEDDEDPVKLFGNRSFGYPVVSHEKNPKQFTRQNTIQALSPSTQFLSGSQSQSSPLQPFTQPVSSVPRFQPHQVPAQHVTNPFSGFQLQSSQVASQPPVSPFHTSNRNNNPPPPPPNPYRTSRAFTGARKKF
ncbi:1976_t:CDS:1 [Funneliformis geosporum]|uniref:1889_t:CDS:1 n=1 Tax=Funneliformis geosporum TaxID=1117311 RepID=A0A9W4WLU9_9GLOM|nr:1976_t:CDS:1 [Funneliformis geosporum]CAI2171663.1 1889_t:CDS:1 [Funneliformis geosporum]